MCRAGVGGVDPMRPCWLRQKISKEVVVDYYFIRHTLRSKLYYWPESGCLNHLTMTTNATIHRLSSPWSGTSIHRTTTGEVYLLPHEPPAIRLSRNFNSVNELSQPEVA